MFIQVLSAVETISPENISDDTVKYRSVGLITYWFFLNLTFNTSTQQEWTLTHVLEKLRDGKAPTIL